MSWDTGRFIVALASAAVIVAIAPSEPIIALICLSLWLGTAPGMVDD